MDCLGGVGEVGPRLTATLLAKPLSTAHLTPHDQDHQHPDRNCRLPIWCRARSTPLPSPTATRSSATSAKAVQGFRSVPFHPQYDVMPDGQRFVMIRNLGGQEAGELIVVENFFEELKAKVGRE